MIVKLYSYLDVAWKQQFFFVEPDCKVTNNSPKYQFQLMMWQRNIFGDTALRIYNKNLL